MNRKALVGLVIFLFLVGMAIVGKLWNIDLDVNYENRFLPPFSDNHILGTDYAGRDIFILIVKGSYSVIFTAILTGFISTFISVVLGILAAFLGRIIDNLISRLADIFITVPSFPVIAIIASVFRLNDIFSFSLLLSIWFWPSFCLAVRNQVVAIKSREFILLHLINGTPLHYVIFYEIFPLIMPLVLINFINVTKASIIAAVGIMMLGIVPLDPSNWGMMINLAIGSTAAMYIPHAFSYLFTPIFFIILFQLSLVLLSSGIEELFDPRLRKPK